MKRIVIKEPMWKNKSVGMRENVPKDGVEIEITHRQKDRTRTFPHIYHCSRSLALSSPPKYMSDGKILRMVKIEDLEIIGDLL
jgi:hypothetical protein